jgi:hypothetical protein
MSSCLNLGFSGFHDLNSILSGQLVKAVLLDNISILFDFVPQLCEVQRYNVFLSLSQALESALLLSLVYVLKRNCEYIDCVVLHKICLVRGIVIQSIL